MLQQQLTAASETTAEHQRQNESIRLRNAELIEELKAVSRREQEVKCAHPINTIYHESLTPQSIYTTNIPYQHTL